MYLLFKFLGDLSHLINFFVMVCLAQAQRDRIVSLLDRLSGSRIMYLLFKTKAFNLDCTVIVDGFISDTSPLLQNQT